MKLRHTLAIAALGALVFGCVEHRPVRNGLRDESIYLDKTALTVEFAPGTFRPSTGTQARRYLPYLSLKARSFPSPPMCFSFP